MKLILDKKEITEAVAAYIGKRPKEIQSIKVRRRISGTEGAGSVEVVVREIDLSRSRPSKGQV